MRKAKGLFAWSKLTAASSRQPVKDPVPLVYQAPPYCGSMSANLPKPWVNSWTAAEPELLCTQEAGGQGGDSVIQQLFGLGLHTRLLCAESGETIDEDSTVYELKCNITVDVNHLTEGIRLGLQDDREKNSEQLGRLALFAVSLLVLCLPAPPQSACKPRLCGCKADRQQIARRPVAPPSHSRACLSAKFARRKPSAKWQQPLCTHLLCWSVC